MPTHSLLRKEGNVLFNDALNTLNFSYGNKASDIWSRTTQIMKEETRCRHIGYSFRVSACFFLYMHHPTEKIAHNTAFVTPVVEHWLEREITQWVHHEGSLLRNFALYLKTFKNDTAYSSFSYCCIVVVIIIVVIITVIVIIIVVIVIIIIINIIIIIIIIIINNNNNNKLFKHRYLFTMFIYRCIQHILTTTQTKTKLERKLKSDRIGWLAYDIHSDHWTTGQLTPSQSSHPPLFCSRFATVWVGYLLLPENTLVAKRRESISYRPRISVSLKPLNHKPPNFLKQRNKTSR